MNKEIDNFRLLILKQEEYEAKPELRNRLEGIGGIIRSEWPKVYESPKYSGWMSRREEHPMRIILTSEMGDVLSHAGIISREFESGKNTMVFAGLGGIIVRPDRRGEGLGGVVTKIATTWLYDNAEQFDLNLGILSCHTEHVNFYKKFGWQRVGGQEHLHFGENHTSAKPHPETIMSIPLSVEGAFFLDDLREASPVYLGKPF